MFISVNLTVRFNIFHLFYRTDSHRVHLKPINVTTSAASLTGDKRIKGIQRISDLCPLVMVTFSGGRGLGVTAEAVKILVSESCNKMFKRI